MQLSVVRKDNEKVRMKAHSHINTDLFDCSSSRLACSRSVQTSSIVTLDVAFGLLACVRMFSMPIRWFFQMACILYRSFGPLGSSLADLACVMSPDSQ